MAIQIIRIFAQHELASYKGNDSNFFKLKVGKLINRPYQNFLKKALPQGIKLKILPLQKYVITNPKYTKD